ncbi:MAG: acyl carrier protein [Lachnospiraceae bacterium]|nr:acyl carrier protein [Lachnospiraceae bacterium]
MIFRKIRDIIAERTDIDPANITPDTNMKEDLQADSLDLFQIISDIEDEFGIDIDSPSDIVYVSDAVEMVKRLLEDEA